MKRLTVLLLASYFLLLTSATPTLTFQNAETQPGETILATITTIGEFTSEITSAQISFKEGRKSASFEYDITEHNQTHYLYIYANRQGNFTIQVENILYKEADQLKSTAITKNFTIQTETTSETQILQIKPGFIFTTTTPTLRLYNLGNSQLNIAYNETEIELSPQETRQIEYETNEPFSTLILETYKTFEIPVIFAGQIKNETQVNEKNQTNEPILQANLKPEAQNISIQTTQNNETTIKLQLYNFADNNITDIETTTNLEIIHLETPEELPARATQNLTITIDTENTGYFNGTINITYTENEIQNLLQVPITIYILQENASIENITIEQETCANLSGQVCESGTICNGTAIFTNSDNPEYCCLATCVSTVTSSSSSSSFGWILAILIIIVLVATGYHLYKKQKQIKPQTAQEKLQTQEKQYSKRITGGLTKT